MINIYRNSMKIGLNLFVIILSLTIFGFTVYEDWYIIDEIKFKISFPFEPKLDSVDVDSPVGKLRAYNYMLEMEEGSADSNLVYGFSKSKYPDKYNDQLGAGFSRGVLDGVVNGAVKGVNGKLISEKEIVLNKSTGREIIVDYGDGVAVIKMRFYLDKSDLYSVQTISITGKENNSNAEKFMESFMIK